MGQSHTSRIGPLLARCRAERRTALIPYLTAGFPQTSDTVPIMHALVRAGADVIELGMPFSDPMADGPAIQRANERALANGETLAATLAKVRAFRADDARTPIVLMGYANPIEAMGTAAFLRNASEAGVDGLIIVDYPPEEAAQFAQDARAAGVDPIFLLAPTTPPDRMRAVLAHASGYVYYVSLTGITGSGHLDTAQVAERVAVLRAQTTLPIGVGFGIKDAASALAIARAADAVVIGSRLIQVCGDAPTGQAAQHAHDFLAPIRAALDARNTESTEPAQGVRA